MLKKILKDQPVLGMGSSGAVKIDKYLEWAPTGWSAHTKKGETFETPRLKLKLETLNLLGRENSFFQITLNEHQPVDLLTKRLKIWTLQPQVLENVGSKFQDLSAFWEFLISV